MWPVAELEDGHRPLDMQACNKAGMQLHGRPSCPSVLQCIRGARDAFGGHCLLALVLCPAKIVFCPRDKATQGCFASDLDKHDRDMCPHQGASWLGVGLSQSLTNQPPHHQPPWTLRVRCEAGPQPWGFNTPSFAHGMAHVCLACVQSHGLWF